MQVNPALLATATPRQREAAQQFEAQMLGQMLGPMFNTVNSARGGFGGGAAEEQWRPMLTDAFAAGMARTGGIGLAPMVLAHMLRLQSAHPEQEIRP